MRELRTESAVVLSDMARPIAELRQFFTVEQGADGVLCFRDEEGNEPLFSVFGIAVTVIFPRPAMLSKYVHKSVLKPKAQD